MMTCENHPNMRWHCKGIAVSDNGRYNGQRNIFFTGIMFGDVLERFDAVTHMEHKECSCPGSSLIWTDEYKALRQKEKSNV